MPDPVVSPQRNDTHTTLGSQIDRDSGHSFSVGLGSVRMSALRLQAERASPTAETKQNTVELIAREAVTTLGEISIRIRESDPSSHEISRLHRDREVLTHCLVATDVYSNGDSPSTLPSDVIRLRGDALKLFVGSGFTEQMLKDDKSGYFASLYFDRGTNTFILANRGTENLPDWINDIRQAPGLKARQYSMAIEGALALKKSLHEKYGPGVRLTFNGHSLGGGLASAQAIVTDSPGVTFNAAGLNRRTIERYDSSIIEERVRKIHAYRVSKEILTATQDRINGALGALGDHLMPEAIATPITIEPATRASAVTLHGMASVTAAVLHRVSSAEGETYARLR